MLHLSMIRLKDLSLLLPPVLIRTTTQTTIELSIYIIQSIAHDPNNPLLLANYAQFLYLVTHEFERAEYYFKKATSVEPSDAEAHNKYANFFGW
ncbi:unnamed protein product [Rhodiola kirilowii]